MEAMEVVREKTGGRQKGTLNKKTVLLKELGINSYKDLFEMLLISWIELLNHEDIRIRLIALKELSKYVLADETRHKTRELLKEGDDCLSYL